MSMSGKRKLKLDSVYRYATMSLAMSKKKSPISDELRQSYTALMEKYARQGIIVTPRKTDTLIPLASSKVGGCPDLVPNFEWPTYTDPDSGETTPLAFLAQFNLSEISKMDTNHELPPSGMLYFFYDFAAERWGESSEDEGCARAIYIEDIASLERGAFPESLDEDYHLPECCLTFDARPIPPDMGNVVEDESMTSEIESLCDGDWDTAAGLYQDLRPEYMGRKEKDDYTPLLLGNPDVLQDAMEADCERICGDEEGDSEAARQNWVLLFQFCNVFDADEGDYLFSLDFFYGHRYFWIRRDDLESRRFEKTWMMLQCD